MLKAFCQCLDNRKRRRLSGQQPVFEYDSAPRRGLGERGQPRAGYRIERQAHSLPARDFVDARYVVFFIAHNDVVSSQSQQFFLLGSRASYRNRCRSRIPHHLNGRQPDARRRRGNGDEIARLHGPDVERGRRRPSDTASRSSPPAPASGWAGIYQARRPESPLLRPASRTGSSRSRELSQQSGRSMPDRRLRPPPPPRPRLHTQPGRELRLLHVLAVIEHRLSPVQSDGLHPQAHLALAGLLLTASPPVAGFSGPPSR